jgi:hypothetical protein
MASSASAARLKVIDASATESGPALRFRVRLIGHTERPVRVSYSTVSGSARAGSDFSTVMGQLGFLPETRKRTIVVNVLPDTIVEGRETFSVKLWKPIGASIARGHATGTIRDDDTPPAIGSAGTPRGPPSAAAPKVVINELLPDPRGVAADQEFVELLNASPSPVDLDGWTLDANGDCALAGVLPPGGLHVVSDDPLIRDSACAPSLPGTGGTVTLRDGPPGSGAVIDSLDYAGFPIALGESIGLDPTKADPAENDLSSSWCSAFASGAVLYGPSENLGTPGSANGSCKH